MRQLNVSDRSAPIVVNADGTASWAGKDYPSREDAHDARLMFRCWTFGIVYGGSGK